VLSVADAIISSGMRDLGYEYINLDDCWEAKARDDQGRLRANPRR
jgi:alpha-galactosidase